MDWFKVVYYLKVNGKQHIGQIRNLTNPEAVSYQTTLRKLFKSRAVIVVVQNATTEDIWSL